MSFVEFFIANWDSILAALVVIIIAVVAVVKQEKAVIFKMLFSLVTEAEKQYGSGTGELKLSSVVSQLYAKLPIAATIIPVGTVEKWVEEASKPISDNSSNGNPDWCSGYGYQIWINAKEGFRGDGAFGQLCMVLPERDMVVAVMANCTDMQKEIDGVFDLINGNLSVDESENIGFATLGKSEKKNP